MTWRRSAGRSSTAEFRELSGVINEENAGGALVLGAAGIGKTNLVEAVLAEPGVPAPLMRLYGSPTLHEVPYGALSPYLGALQSVEEPVAVLRELNRQLSAAAEHPGRKLVIVEDAHYLDAQSGFVLSLLVDNAQLKLVAVGSGVPEADSPLGLLADAARLSTIVVQPLTRQGVQAAAESWLDGTLSEGTVRMIEMISGGNPSLVEAYVHSSLEQGTLFRDELLCRDRSIHAPVWIAARPMPNTDARLVAVVTQWAERMSLEERDTVELLALGGPQRVALLEQLGLPWRRLLASGELAGAAGQRVELASELHASVLREIIPEEHSALLNRRWKDASRQLGGEPSARELLWSLEIGIPVEPGAPLRAAQRAAAEQDYQLALALCQLAGLPQHSEQGALLEAEALLGLGRHYTARAVLLRLIEKLTDLDLLGEAFSLLLIVTTTLGTKMAELQELLGIWQSKAALYRDPQQAQQFLQVQRAGGRVLQLWSGLNRAGAPRPEAEELRQLLDGGQLPLQARMVSLITLADLYSIQGRSRDAVDTAREALVMLGDHAQLAALHRDRVFFRIAWNLICQGEYAQAGEFIGEYRGTRVKGTAQFQGTISLLIALGDLLQGRKHQAVAKLAEAVSELRIIDTAQVLSLASGLYRALLSGMGAAAGAPAEALGPDAPGSADAAGPEAPEQRVFARAMAAVMGAAHSGESIADFPVLEREVLLFALGELDDHELEDAPQVQRLQLLATAQQGKRPELIAKLVELCRTEEGGPLEELGRLAEERGEHLLATEAMARAAARYLAAGENRRGGALLRRTRTLIDEQGLNARKYVARTLALTELTARELEIVELARSGMNNARIASALTVSQRTVEGHLYRVFSKLGITERSELAEATRYAGTGGFASSGNRAKLR